MARPHTILGIQYLRGIAALVVLFAHICTRYNVDFGICTISVDIFFVISGLMMWLTTDGYAVTFGSFLLKRLRRLAPLYWIATATIIVFAKAKPKFFDGVGVGIDDILKSFLFIPYYNASHHTWPIDLQGWTLNVQMLYYLIFGIAVSMSLWRRLWIPTMITTSLVVIGGLVHPVSAVGVLWTSQLLMEMVAGLWLGFAFTRGWLDHRRVGSALIVASLIVLGFYQLHGIPVDNLRCIISGIPALALVTGCLMIEQNNKMPKLPALLFLGDASYSIYIWHSLAIIVVSAMNLRFGISEAGFTGGLLLGVLALALTLAAYVLIERPLLARIPRPSIPLLPTPHSRDAY